MQTLTFLVTQSVVMMKEHFEFIFTVLCALTLLMFTIYLLSSDTALVGPI